ncbi:MAG TPA: endonuclease/exonuclease/phosphatase family protein, partial [Myxococcota bacterium]
MRVISWNVNGLRAILQKDFDTWLDASGADVVGLQEVRATADQLKAELVRFEERGWHVHISAAE